MSKKKSNPKRNFLLLTAFFGLLTLTGLLLLWSNPPEPTGHTTKMGTTMGAMAKNEMGPIALQDLFKPGEFIKSDMSSHHQGNNLIAKTHFATTTAITISLPLIAGGLAVLLLLWI